MVTLLLVQEHYSWSARRCKRASGNLTLHYASQIKYSQLRITCRAYVTSPEANRAEGLCGGAARRSAAQPEAPSQAPTHIRAVIGGYAVALIRTLK